MLKWIALIVVVLCQTAAYAGPLEDCEQDRDADRRLRGCTERIRQFPRDATAYFNRGSAYLSEGELDHAIADQTRVIQLDPAYAAAYLKRGLNDALRQVNDLKPKELLQRRYERLQSYGRFNDTTER